MFLTGDRRLSGAGPAPTCLGARRGRAGRIWARGVRPQSRDLGAAGCLWEGPGGRGIREKTGWHEAGEGGAGDGAPDPLPHLPLLFPQPGQGARAAERCKQPKKMLPERHENEVNKRDKNGNIKTATSLLITKQAAGAGAGPQKQLRSRAGLIRDRQPGPVR